MQCLFTPQVEDSAEEEHAPPKRMGGRFRSTTTTSSSFNHASSRLDAMLVDAWRLVTVHLAPAMSSEHRSDAHVNVEIEGQSGRWALFPGGGAQRVTIEHIEREPDGRPKTFAGPPDAVRALAARLFPDAGDAAMRLELPWSGGEVRRQQQLVSRELEIAALKSILVAFDISYGTSAASWVRSAATETARNLVRAAILDDGWSVPAYGRVVCGTDPRLIEPLRDAAKAAGHLAPLDHVMLASSPKGSRVIDASWLVFGHEVISFRLSDDYLGDPFTRILVCPPLARGERRVFDSDEPWMLTALGLRGMATPSNQPMDLVPAIVNSRSRAAEHAWAYGQAALSAKEMAEILFNWAVVLARQATPAATVAALCVDRIAEPYRRQRLDIGAWTVDELAREMSPDLMATPILIEEPVAAGEVARWALECVEPYQRVVARAHLVHGAPRLIGDQAAVHLTVGTV